MEEQKFTESFLIEEYKAFWDYYKQTLTERKQLFDWYLLIITLPSSLVGFLIMNKTGKIQLPYDVAAAILLVIFFIGFSLFVTYANESRNSENYLKSIKKIREYIISISPEFEDVLIIDKTRQKNMHVFGLDRIRFFRSSIFIMINSAILPTAIELFYNRKNWITIIIIFSISFSIHVLFYVIINKKVYKK